MESPLGILTKPSFEVNMELFEMAQLEVKWMNISTQLLKLSNIDGNLEEFFSIY